MPRVTAAHEQAVRQRIVEAAIKVFGELGVQRATVQDVVRECGLSVGAVYTHFASKNELFVAACTYEIDAEKSDLRARLAQLGDVADRLRVAIDFSIDSAVFRSDEGQVRIHASMAAMESPELKQMLWDRRTEMVAFARFVLDESLQRGELPAWIDADGIASAFVTLIDGFIVRAAESGNLTREQVRRDAYALVELLVAAPMEMPPAVKQLRTVAVSRQN